MVETAQVARRPGLLVTLDNIKPSSVGFEKNSHFLGRLRKNLASLSKDNALLGSTRSAEGWPDRSGDS